MTYDMSDTQKRSYHQIFVRRATDVLTGVATEHEAREFFANRTLIAANMENKLKKHFESEGDFIIVPLFQFQAVDLPGDSARFETAIRETQVADQMIKRVLRPRTLCNSNSILSVNSM